MNFTKESNPLNAAPKELPQETKKSHEKEVLPTNAMKPNDNQRLVQPDRRPPLPPNQSIPILQLHGNQKIAVGPSIADSTLLPTLVPIAKIELTNEAAVGSFAKDSDSTQMSLAKAKQQGSNSMTGITPVNSVIVVRERSSMLPSGKPKSHPKPKTSKPKSKCGRTSNSYSSSFTRDEIRRNASSSEKQTVPIKASSSKVATANSRIVSTNSTHKASRSRDTIEKCASKTKSPHPKTKPSSSKGTVPKTSSKSDEKMEKIKPKNENTKRQASRESKKTVSRTKSRSTTKPRTSGGKAKTTTKTPKSAESAKSNNGKKSGTKSSKKGK